MSVINRMLQDMENRHAIRRADPTVSAQVKAVPERSPPYVGWILLAMLLTTGGGLAVWWLKPIPGAVRAAPVLVTTPAADVLTRSSGNRAPPLTVNWKQPHAVAHQISRHGATTQDFATPLVLPQRSAPPEPPAAFPSDGAVSALPGLHEPQPVLFNTGLRPDAPQLITTPPASLSTMPEHTVVNDQPETAVAKQIKQITPRQRSESEYRTAVALLQSGRLTEAAESLDQLLRIDPGNVAARQTLVGLLVDGKRDGDARRQLQDGLKLDPAQTGLAMILARLQIDQGNTQGALRTLQSSLSYAAQLPEYQSFLAALLQREGRHKEAIEHYLQALREAPESGVWLMGLGISLQAENRVGEARAAFQRAGAGNTLSPDLQAFVEQQLQQSRLQ